MPAVCAGRMGGHRGHGDVDRGAAVRAVGRDVPEAADRVGVQQDDLGMMGRVEPDPDTLANFETYTASRAKKAANCPLLSPQSRYK